jgi:ribonuclease HI
MDDRSVPRGVAVLGLGPAEVHFDGACERTGRGSIAGFGYTVSGPGLDHEGYGLAVPPFHPRATNNVAEYAGAICALEWLVRQGFAGDVTVRGDSQLVIRQMTGEYRIRAEHLKAYHDRLRQLCEGFRRVDFAWIPRDQNQRADRLSKQAVADASYPRRKRSALTLEPQVPGAGDRGEGD